MDYECVQPELGDELWQYDVPECDADLRSELDRHLTVCDACRLERAVLASLETDEISGTLLEMPGKVRTLPSPRRRTVPGRGLVAGGWAALAASLVMAFLIPPGTTGFGTTRGDTDEAGFVRPVEGEAVVDGSPELSWKPVPGATGYRIVLSEIDGDYEWSGESESTNLAVTDQEPLPDRGRFRAMVETVPADLTPPEGISVTFRRTGPAAFAAYRLEAAPALLKVLGLLGLVVGLSGWVARRVAVGAFEGEQR